MKIIPLLAAVLLAASVPAWAAPAHHKPAASHVALPTAVRPDRYDIRIVPNAEALIFEGHEKIALTVKAPTDRIVLNAADIAIGRASLSDEPNSPKMVHDEAQQTTAFLFGHKLAPGR